MRFVNAHVSNPGQKLGASVFTRARSDKMGPLIDERSGEITGEEGLIIDHCLEERNIGGDSSNPELCKTSPGSRDGYVEGSPSRGHLGQHRIEVGRDLGSLVDRSAVQSNSCPARRTIGRYFSGVGSEVCSRVFGRNATLHGKTAQHNGLLREPD